MIVGLRSILGMESKRLPRISIHRRIQSMLVDVVHLRFHVAVGLGPLVVLTNGNEVVSFRPRRVLHRRVMILGVMKSMGRLVQESPSLLMRVHSVERMISIYRPHTMDRIRLRRCHRLRRVLHIELGLEVMPAGNMDVTIVQLLSLSLDCRKVGMVVGSERLLQDFVMLRDVRVVSDVFHVLGLVVRFVKPMVDVVNLVLIVLLTLWSGGCGVLMMDGTPDRSGDNGTSEIQKAADNGDGLHYIRMAKVADWPAAERWEMR